MSVSLHIHAKPEIRSVVQQAAYKLFHGTTDTPTFNFSKLCLLFFLTRHWQVALASLFPNPPGHFSLQVSLRIITLLIIPTVQNHFTAHVCIADSGVGKCICDCANRMIFTTLEVFPRGMQNILSIVKHLQINPCAQLKATKYLPYSVTSLLS